MPTHAFFHTDLDVGHLAAKQVFWNDVGCHHPPLHAWYAQMGTQAAWRGVVEGGKLLRGAAWYIWMATWIRHMVVHRRPGKDEVLMGMFIVPRVSDADVDLAVVRLSPSGSLTWCAMMCGRTCVARHCQSGWSTSRDASNGRCST